jgi:hypothetical protein
MSLTFVVSTNIDASNRFMCPSRHQGSVKALSNYRQVILTFKQLTVSDAQMTMICFTIPDLQIGLSNYTVFIEISIKYKRRNRFKRIYRHDPSATAIHTRKHRIPSDLRS